MNDSSGTDKRASADPGVAPILSDAEFELFRKLIYDAAGISMAPSKKALISGRLSKRLRELGYATFREYFNWIDKARNDPAALRERQNAIDHLTTNETYFFREPRHFEFIEKRLIPHWAGRSVRLWSAASSSGEEAYTLAMVMEQHHRGSWEIVGTDISTRVVAAATRGQYPLLRANNIPKEFLRKYCLKGVGEHAGTFRLESKLRRKVSFRAANLQEDLSSVGMFDLVMLRNVLIYFDLEIKKRVVANVLRQLKPGGCLMVGHAESLHGVTAAVKAVQPATYIKEGD
ncbi:CheR family methyltransferase [Wenzhouxiangella limi]|uniref:CheR family methyltransferase n=1 Tax=Wenzhouxiangella limi TaxID=2707351 RepID=UPI001EF1A981|nr:protein-glutamate O-methyltransferase CheR [Wenzhouxiangella limi]